MDITKRVLTVPDGFRRRGIINPQVFLVRCLVVVLALSTCGLNALKDGFKFRNRPSNAEGRIEKIDDFLLIHALDVAGEANYDLIREGIQRLVDEHEADADPEFEKYYLEVLDMIERDGLEVIPLERDRLDAIISSSNFGSRVDGGAEFRYATVRKNILNAYIEVAAEVTMAMVTQALPKEVFQEDAQRRRRREYL